MTSQSAFFFSPIPVLFAALALAAAASAGAAERQAPAQPTDVDDVDPTGSAAQRAAATDRPAGPVKNPVLPPKWAFGVLFACYWDQAKVLETAQRLRQEYCGDLLWVDSSWLSGDYTDRGQNHYINFTFDPAQFPDPRAMIATLRTNHFNFGVWEWPYIERSITNLYSFGESNRFFITDEPGGQGAVVNGGGWHGVRFTGQLDFSNPKAVEWWKQLNQPLLDMGVNFFKIDTYSTLPRGGGVAFDGGGSENLRRLYHKTYYELTEKASGGRGFYLAHRTPTPENDQYPGMWTGDTQTSWPGFVEDLKRGAAMNTPQTAAYWCSDTGGYNRDVPGDALYIRWLQYGTFLPINEFFSAKGTKGRFPWLFGEDAQRNFKFYTKLRYRLLPFRYSNAQIAYHEKPVKYPVRFFGGHTNGIIVGNGDSEMLVAPVYEEGATQRVVQLPAGNSWINYWTGEVYRGGTAPTVAAPLDRVPIFVKAGSIVPMGPEIGWVEEKPADPLTLDIYPSGKSSYALYEDDGRSNDYRQGRYSKTLLTCAITPGRAVVDIGAAQGDFTGRLTSRTYLLKINRQIAAPLQISRNDAPLKPAGSRTAFESTQEGWFNDAEGSSVWVKVTTPTGLAVRIVLDSPDFKD